MVTSHRGDGPGARLTPRFHAAIPIKRPKLYQCLKGTIVYEPWQATRGTRSSSWLHKHHNVVCGRVLNIQVDSAAAATRVKFSSLSITTIAHRRRRPALPRLARHAPTSPSVALDTTLQLASGLLLFHRTRFHLTFTYICCN
ncbi:unnamed protein product, partial [Brenthis ino]